MRAEEILLTLQKDIHTVIMATNDENNNPITCAIDIMLCENNKLYFLTARGKAFYNRLMKNKFVALTGIKGESTMTSVAISLQGKVRNIGSNKLDEIFKVNPYMAEIYPSEKSRNVLEVFEIYELNGEYFDLSQKPIFRQSFSVGSNEKNINGYFITDKCVGCGNCYDSCPQSCINTSTIPAVIKQEHCLHCGKCAEVCSFNAVVRKQAIN